MRCCAGEWRLFRGPVRASVQQLKADSRVQLSIPLQRVMLASSGADGQHTFVALLDARTGEEIRSSKLPLQRLSLHCDFKLREPFFLGVTFNTNRLRVYDGSFAVLLSLALPLHSGTLHVDACSRRDLLASWPPVVQLHRLSSGQPLPPLTGAVNWQSRRQEHHVDCGAGLVVARVRSNLHVRKLPKLGDRGRHLQAAQQAMALKNEGKEVPAALRELLQIVKHEGSDRPGGKGKLVDVPSRVLAWSSGQGLRRLYAVHEAEIPGAGGELMDTKELLCVREIGRGGRLVRGWPSKDLAPVASLLALNDRVLAACPMFSPTALRLAHLRTGRVREVPLTGEVMSAIKHVQSIHLNRDSVLLQTTNQADGAASATSARRFLLWLRFGDSDRAEGDSGSAASASAAAAAATKLSGAGGGDSKGERKAGSA